MPGAKVTAKATYCGHTLQAETDLNYLGQWTGRCVVEGPSFQGTVVLHSPFPAPAAALERPVEGGSAPGGRGAKRRFMTAPARTRRLSTRRRRFA